MDGIFKIANSDAELATVLAHEIGHAVARHSAEDSSQKMAMGVGITVLSTAASIGTSVATRGAFTPDAGAVADVLGAGATLGVMLPFSRQQELEADRIGLIYMARAGYDPQAAVTFWKKMAVRSRTEGDATPSILRTHPLDERRIRELEKHMPNALVEYQANRN